MGKTKRPISRRSKGKDGLTPLQRERAERRKKIDAAFAKRHPSAASNQRALRKQQAMLSENWRHKNQGTPETHGNASRTHQGALAQLHMNETISSDQLAWAAEISAVAEQIERGVAVKTASLEARVDSCPRNGDALVEGLMRVRHEMAYGRWRGRIESPARAVLDMIVGEPLGYSIVAKRYRMHPRRAKRMLLHALDLWPDCLDWACSQVDREGLTEAHAELAR